MSRRQLIETVYLEKVYHVDRYQKLIKRLIKKIQAFKKKIPFDAIAFTGTSGAAAAYAVSYELKIPLICVRKKDNNHCGLPIEGAVTAKSYIILDDFIDQGKTIKKIISTIKKCRKNNKSPDNNPVGIILYNDCGGYKNWLGIPIVRV